MSRLLGIMISIVLLISMGIGAAAHASEQICLPDIEVTASVGHADGDTDQTRDTDGGYPHHHGGCHGHHLATPVDTANTSGSATQSSDLVATGSALIAIAAPGATLRPPIA